MGKIRLVRITTIPVSLKILLSDQLKFMGDSGFEVIAISANGKEIEEIVENEKCLHYIVPMTRRITPFLDLYCLLRLWFLFRKIQPSIVHSHTPKAGLLSMIAARFCKIPIRIHTVGGMSLVTTAGIKRRILQLCEILTYNCATHVWPNSFEMLDFIIRHKWCSLHKLSVVHQGSSNGVDLRRFSPTRLNRQRLQQIQQQIKYDQNKIYLVFIGRLVKDKGIETLVAAFRMIALKYSVQLILIGEYESFLDPISQSTLEEIVENPNILHIPWSNEVEYYLACANFLVHPSYREGFPNVLLEAGAMRCPIICSDIPGHRDMIQHLKTGLLFALASIHSLVETIHFAIENPKKLAEMSCHLRHNIENFYNRPIVHAAIAAKYHSYLNSHKK